MPPMTTPYILPIKEPRESIENIKDKMKDATMTCLWCRVNVAFFLRDWKVMGF